MKKTLSLKTTFIVASSLFYGYTHAQVGVNNTTPKATFDVTAKATDGSLAEGLIAPRLTGNQIQLADLRYGALQKGAIVYATEAVTSASTKTANITKEGYYFFDGNIWQKITTGQEQLNLTGSGSTTVTGTYPNLTVSTPAAPAQVNLTGSGATTVTGTYPNLTISTPAASAQVNLTGSGATTVTGTYPNLTVTTPNATTTGVGAVQLSGDLAGTATAPVIANNAITTTKIADGSITNAKIAANAVGTTNIINSSVTTAKIAPSATNGQVLTTTGGVTTWATPIAQVNLTGSGATTVTGTYPNLTVSTPAAPAQVNLTGSGATTVTGTYPNLTVTTPNATTTGVGAVQLSGDLAGTATAPVIANNAITTAKIANANVTNAKLATNAVGTTNIIDANVTTAKIANANITNAKLATNAVGTTNIIDGNVTTAKIADGNVTNAKIAANAVGTTNIIDANVTTAKIANASVTTAKIAPGTNGQVLTTTGGATAWTTLPSLIAGDRSLATQNIGVAGNLAISNQWRNTKLKITIPANSKYMVYYSYVFTAQDGNQYVNQPIYFSTALSEDSSAGPKDLPDTDPSLPFGNKRGTAFSGVGFSFSYDYNFFVNNTSASPKTFYVWVVVAPLISFPNTAFFNLYDGPTYQNNAYHHFYAVPIN
jgi:hypothetical protein